MVDVSERRNPGFEAGKSLFVGHLDAFLPGEREGLVYREGVGSL